MSKSAIKHSNPPSSTSSIGYSHPFNRRPSFAIMSVVKSSIVVPQALSTGLSTRIKKNDTALLINTAPVRSTKRSTTQVSYAEIDEDFEDADEEDEDYSEDGSVPTPSSSAIAERAKRLLAQSENRASGRKLALKTPHVTVPEESLLRAAESGKPSVRVPIRLDFEPDNVYRVNDFFIWDLSDEFITPEQFARIMVQDLDLPAASANQISSSIRSQLEEYAFLETVSLPEGSINVLIELSVNLDKQLYEDRFEWDLNTDVTPEEFALTVVQDMGLMPEFWPAIAHALYEQIAHLKREALEGHVLGVSVENLAFGGAEVGWRFDEEGLGDKWSPKVETLSQWEIEKREIERERNLRRLKRESMRMAGGDVADSNMLSGVRRRSRRTYDDSLSRSGSPGFHRW